MNALNTCHILIITRDAYLIASDRYPQRSANKDLEVDAKASYKQLIKEIESHTSKKRVMRKSVMISSNDLPDNDEVLRKFFKIWHADTRKRLEKRRREQKTESLNKAAVDRFLDQAITGRQKRKQVLREKEFSENFRADDSEFVSPLPAKSRSKRKQAEYMEAIFPVAPRASVEDCNCTPYDADPRIVVDVAYPPPRPGRSLLSRRQGSRSQDATKKHLRRLLEAAARPVPELPPRPTSDEPFADGDASTIMPRLLRPSLVAKSSVDAFAIRPILRASKIDSAR
jgi:hypothetical protein